MIDLNEKRTTIDAIYKIVQLIVLIGSILFGFYIFVRYESVQKQLTLNLLKDQSAISEIIKHKSDTPRIKCVPDLSVSESGKSSSGGHYLEIRFAFSIENISDIDISIPYYIVTAYRGKNKIELSSSSSLVLLNEPFEKVSNDIDQSVIDWKMIHSLLAYTDGVDIDKVVGIGNFNIKKQNIYATGELRSGENTEACYRYILKSDYNDYIGFIVKIAISSENGIKKKFTTVSWSKIKQLIPDSIEGRGV